MLLLGNTKLAVNNERFHQTGFARNVTNRDAKENNLTSTHAWLRIEKNSPSVHAFSEQNVPQVFRGTDLTCTGTTY